MTPLAFERPPAQGPGTSGFAFISDPTIQPFLAPGAPAGIWAWESIDLQGNGRPDIVVCHGSFPPSPVVKGPCRVLRPQPDGSVADITRQLFGAGALPSSINPSEILSGDFNRDGRPDIFVAAFGYDTAPFSGETNVLLISNADGTYTDRSTTLPQTPTNGHSASVGDIDGDGNLDIYVGNWGGNGAPVGPYFLMGRGDGTFRQKTTGLPSSIGWRPLDEKFATCLLVDLDGDTSLDLVLGITPNPSGHSIVLFNDGTGDFTRRPRVVLPEGPAGKQPRGAGYCLTGCQPRWPPGSHPPVMREGLPGVRPAGADQSRQRIPRRSDGGASRSFARESHWTAVPIHPSRGFQRRWIAGLLSPARVWRGPIAPPLASGSITATARSCRSRRMRCRRT